MVRRRFSREQWAEWISEQAVSGLGVSAFCESKGIPVQSFYLWRRKLALVERPEGARSLFLPVSVSGLGQVEIDMPCGATIRVPPDAAATRRVIDALLQAGGGR